MKKHVICLSRGLLWESLLSFFKSAENEEEANEATFTNFMNQVSISKGQQTLSRIAEN